MAYRFDGFPPEAIEFFDGLESNNNRTWFQANKEIYERACREPMKALVAELSPEFGEAKIFRINRDVRFSNDKSPYKTNIAAVVGRNYVSLGTDGLYVGGGIYRPDAAGLRKLRAGVADDAAGPELEKIVVGLCRKGFDVDTHEKLKGAPKGYTKDHPRIDLLRHKDIFAGKGFPPEPWLATRKSYDRIRRILADVKPLKLWLDRVLGAAS